MTDLTVIVAPFGSLAGVRDALHDWSAAGLLSRFLWIEPQMVTDSTIHAVSVTDGKMAAVSLDELAGVERFMRLRIATLVPALAGASTLDLDLVQQIAQHLEESFGGAPVSRIRVLVTRVGDRSTIADLAIDGWHNIALSPEDSTGPGVGASQLQATGDLLDIGRYAAAGIAGLLGLWTGCTDAPLDDEPVLPGRLVRLARSYYRKLGSHEVEAEVRGRVLTMTSGLPLPSHVGMSTCYVEDSDLATKTMSDQFWTRHAHILRGPREHTPQAQARAISIGEALRMFGGFLWAAVRNAPRAWATALVMKIKADTASLVHEVVFGAAPSAYAVVVRGTTSDGLPATWLDLSEASATLDRALDDAGHRREHEIPVDMSKVWEDYATGALTLADAGERVPWLPPVQVGAHRAVLRSPGLIVSGDSDKFEELPAHLVPTVGTAEVMPFDVLGAHDLEGRLRQVAQQPSVGVPASASLQALGAWRARVGTTFAAHVGTRIGEALHAGVVESRTLLNQIRQAADAQEALAAVQGKQKRLVRTQRVAAAVAAATLLLAVLLWKTDVIETSRFVWTVFGLCAAWIIVAFVVFFRGQQELFQLINARRELRAGEEAARINLQHALRDVRRLGQAYEQFLCWSRIIAGVLQEPFGRPAGPGGEREQAVSGLPRAVRLGTVVADEASLADATLALRHDTYTVGWLGVCWEAALSSAHRQVGPRALDLVTNPRLMFAERADGTHTILPDWAAAVTAQGVDSLAGDAQWARLVVTLDGPRRALAQGLLQRVSDSHSGDWTTVPYVTFVGGLDDPDRLGTEKLNDAMLVDSARARGASQVVRSWRSVSRHGLSSQVCMTQLSEGIPRYDFLAQADVPVVTEPTRASIGRRILHAGDVPEIFGGQPF